MSMDAATIKLTFLGTGTSQGVPVIACPCAVCASDDPKDKRLRTSVLVETQGKTIVIDTGPDFRQQMLRSKVLDIEAVLFTHEHKDHIAGLDDVRAYNYLHDKAIEVYASSRVEEALKREYHYIFAKEQYPGVPQIHLNHISNEPFEIAGVAIQPIEVLHYRLPVLGFRIGDLCYITDANAISEEEKAKIKGSKVLILNALRREDHLSHFTLEEALALIEEIKPERGYLTHLSHQMGKHADVSLELPDYVSVAYDQLEITL